MTFQLPLPPKELNPNARCHWAVKARAVRAARMVALAEARRVLDDLGCPPPRWPRASMRANVYVLSAKRRPDPDNLMASLKAYLDGLASAGIVANDKELWPERPRFHTCERLPRIEITICPEPEPKNP